MASRLLTIQFNRLIYVTLWPGYELICDLDHHLPAGNYCYVKIC
ncbi:Uncharacterised protein [Raoultella planticola]|nr:Uncharacterised protein [Raoultella planticola]